MANAWIGLIGVLIGALITPLGSWLLETKRHKAERNKLLLNKLEQIVSELYRHDYWLEQQRKHLVTNVGNEPSADPPFSGAEALAHVYLPDVADYLNNLYLAQLQYHAWMIDAAQKRAKTGMVAANGFPKAYAAYRKEFIKTLKAISDYASQNLI